MAIRAFLPRTPLLKNEEVKEFPWFVVDARGRTLGRLASVVASMLRGKASSRFTPNVQCGFGVLIVNAADIVVTGSKLLNKEYHTYSGYIGGQKTLRFETLIKTKPGYILQRAIKGMLPRNKLARKLLSRRLKVFADGGQDLAKFKAIPV